MIIQLLLQIILLLWPTKALAQAPPLNSTKPNCSSKCGNVTIPFPFGIGDGCSIDDWFAVDCNFSKPILRSINLELLEVSVLESRMRVSYPLFNTCEPLKSLNESTGVLLDKTPFLFSPISNMFTGIGCGNFSFRSSDDSVIVAQCSSPCDVNNTKEDSRSCQDRVVSASLKRVIPSVEGKFPGSCNYAFLVEQQWFKDKLLKNPQDVQNFTHVPVAIDWSIHRLSFSRFLKSKPSSYDYLSTSSCQISDCSCFSNQYSVVRCNCLGGFEGNPYLLEGCQDINICKNETICGPNLCSNFEGTYGCYMPASAQQKVDKVVLLGIGSGILGLFLLAGAWWLLFWIKKRNDIKLKEKFFKRNGGLLLRQQLTSFDGSVDRSKLFNTKELDKATDHFNVNRILGQGGQGTVYKGMLEDGRIIAVKKSKVLDQGKLEEFINEVVILSQINHRNVVKLLGCCLETEVPLLVYEFIPNGTLSQYLHDQNEELLLTWEMRLRIATEVAGALSYLHSSAAIPIYHRDIKSTNILLDEKFRAKVADFGTSKSISIDQTHVTTKVQGTFGYLDPEFFRSSQFTDKSDVYSFGVVLVELLTGQKAVFSTSSQEARGLAAHFFLSMEENRLFDILDAQILKLGKKEEIIAVANLAKRCLNLNGRTRPAMKEVAMELEGIQSSQKNGNFHLIIEKVDYTENEEIEAWEMVSASTSSIFDRTAPSVDVEPLLNVE